MNIETVYELIQSLESAGELSIKETKVMALAKAYQQLAAENVGLKDINAWCKTDAFKNMYREFKTAEALGCSDADCMHDAMLVAIMHAPATPATDRIVAAQRSAFVDEAVSKITESGALTLGDCIVALCQLREGASE
ncbi:Uncharacterised protein [Klebsiella pneumoniae]|uniref:hypothetical protein n=1 Tax=Klebsiella pneumoniae TaxID=573 RepID=UPI0007CC0867|nr:Uncharacterised protein [Klebsiella pneumoniae]SAW96248.1 Uncharacterised protein [Klebsiella pneumoniae]